jgi:hypothetical protein
MTSRSNGTGDDFVERGTKYAAASAKTPAANQADGQGVTKHSKLATMQIGTATIPVSCLVSNPMTGGPTGQA